MVNLHRSLPHTLLFVAVFLTTACGAKVAIEDIEQTPKTTNADQKFAGVYAMLDGTWDGEFRIYVDTRGQQSGPSQPTTFDPETWSSPPYSLQSTIDVTQNYVSDSPFFQRVSITDTYKNGEVVRSSGVNKIQDGSMYCVVKKPDDVVVHTGVLESPDTIVWSRSRNTPKSYEFFRETVQGDTYRIAGWGYYGKDDVKKAPRMFFDATYVRRNE